MDKTEESLAIVDSHIHLYAYSHIKDLTWAADLPKDHILNCQNSVEEYLLATQRSQSLLGFVFVETDRVSGLRETEWDHALEEVEFLARIRAGLPKNGEGHREEDKGLVLGVVPWAPIPAGNDVVTRYLAKAKEAAKTEEIWKCVKGFRYLVQDKPRGTLLSTQFLQGLQALEHSGKYSFDLGIDARQGGQWQLQEACEMLESFYKSSNGNLNIVINHLCKPNLRLSAEAAQSGHSDFSFWADKMRKFASFPTTFMKLSGLFSELPPQDQHNPTSIDEMVSRMRPWMNVIFSSFGPSRIMFGSDWPVCNLGGPGRDRSWQHYHDLVVAILYDQQLSTEGRQQVWSGTAIRAYDLKRTL